MASRHDRLTGLQNRFGAATQSLRDDWFAYLLVVPTLLYVLLLVWTPAVRGLWMSFFAWPLFGTPEWLGLDNYTRLLAWDVFYTSLRATVLYGLSTIGQMIVGIIMALIVWKQKRFKRLLSVVFLVPLILPTVVTGTLWRHVLHPNVGPVFKFLVSQGILEQAIFWRLDGTLALAVMTFVGIWTWSSFVFLLAYASLEAIPAEMYESARIYGAGTWERFRWVTFPQIKTALLVALILRVIRNLGKVAQPLQITRGGPGFETSVLGVLLYRLAWLRQDLGLAFATGIMLGILSLVFVAVFIWKFESESEGVSPQ